MFVDLVGSTALSSQLDPEETGDLSGIYQNTVAREITRFERHIAKFLGDGVRAYFGCPGRTRTRRSARPGRGLSLVRRPLPALAATVNFGCPVRSDGRVAAAQICRSLIRARVGRLASPQCRPPYA
jgi:class 3 adenylate cyclase